MTRLLLAALLLPVLHAHPVLVLSVDGLDYRYLRDADKLGLKIPNLRRMMQQGTSAAGVVGVVPTVTWPSHTSLITGVAPAVHGILGNRRPKAEGGDYYWSASLLKVPTLLNAAHAKGLKTAAVTWPVTVDAPVDFNLPEYFVKRNGGAMDLPSIASKGTPGLVEEIAKRYPSFPQEWMNDRTRTLATIYLMQQKHPDLTLVHFVDHDAEAHDHAPFSTEANALVEYTDELIGQILAATPKDVVVIVTSDHGFERTDKVVNLRSIVGPGPMLTPFLAVAKTAANAEVMRNAALKPENGIGREVPLDEVKRLAPQFGDAVAAWEPADHFAFGQGDSKEFYTKPYEIGNHGFWPTRADYRSVFLAIGPGVRAEKLPEIEMTSIAGRLASYMGIEFTPGR